MDKRIIQRSKQSLFSIEFLRSYLRVLNKEQDKLIIEYMNVSIEYLEEHLDQTLLWAKREVIHNNVRFKLPFGPVQHIESVRYHTNHLGPEDYIFDHATGYIELKACVHRNNRRERDITVVYTAGYDKSAHEESDLSQSLIEEESNVPQVHKNAVLRLIQALFNGEDLARTQKELAQWLKVHHRYKLKI